MTYLVFTGTDQHDIFIINLEKYVLYKTAVQKVESRIVHGLISTKRRLNIFSQRYVLCLKVFNIFTKVENYTENMLAKLTDDMKYKVLWIRYLKFKEVHTL